MSTPLRYPDRLPTWVIAAPSNLGLRPLYPGHEPGTWRGPEALLKAGLLEAVSGSNVIELPRPIYDAEAQPGTRLRNGHTMRRFNLAVADAVEEAVADGGFPVVVGGDCSVLLGALAGRRRSGPLSLVHIDGHSDFRHPGNYDSATSLGAVAGMDLALATGRGEALMTSWPGVPPPLVPDEQVVQIGERECRDLDFAWPDVNDTNITRLDVFTANEIGAAQVLARTWATLDHERSWPFWLHLDVDVLDQDYMPAVDSPGSPGLSPEDLAMVLAELLTSDRCAGLTITVFDPDLDQDEQLARRLISLVRQAWPKAAADIDGFVADAAASRD